MENRKWTFAKVLKAIILNIVGFYVGYYLGLIAQKFATYIFIDVLGKLGFLTALLSWPVDYETYALIGIIFVDATITLRSCAFISQFSNAKYNYSCFILGAFRIISYISATIVTIASNGFNFSAIWTIAISLINFIVLTLGVANNEN